MVTNLKGYALKNNKIMIEEKKIAVSFCHCNNIIVIILLEFRVTAH